MFVAQKARARRPQLYVRRLDQLQATPLPGTDGASLRSFPRMGQWIGFFAGGKLKKIAVAGGAAITLGRCAEHRAAARGATTTRSCSRRPTPGRACCACQRPEGSAEPLTSLAEGEVIQLWPQVLPGGKAVLYTSSQHLRRLQRRRTSSCRPAERRAEGRSARWVSRPVSAERPSGLHPRRHAVRGALRSRAPGGHGAAGAGTRRRDVELDHRRGPVCRVGNGTLVYLPGQTPAPAYRSTGWITRAGRRRCGHARELVQSALRARRLPPRHGDPRRTIDIWIYDWEQDKLTRLTSDPVSVPEAGVDPGWPSDRVRIGARRQVDAEPVLAARRRDRRRGAPHREQELQQPAHGIRAASSWRSKRQPETSST